MNQIMAVGEGVVVALDRKVSDREASEFRELWKDRMPDVPVVFFAEAQIVANDGQIVFQFTGEDITSTMVAEFKKWWEEVSK